MELRKEIESLAIWYIPVVVLMSIVAAAYTGFLKEMLSADGLTMGTQVALITMGPKLIQFATNIVVGIWLYRLAKKEGGRQSLWLLFGLVVNLGAALIYIGLRIYEQRDGTQSAFQNT